MTKQELLTKVQAKVGFHSIIKDVLAPDHEAGDPIEKRYLYINHLNADGTMGKTYVFYNFDEANNLAWFYNVETEALDNKAIGADQIKLNALTAYLKANFNAYFVNRFDLSNNWAEADTYKLEASKLTKKAVIVYKQGANPISHLEVV